VANESAVIDLKSSGVEDKLNSLVFQNQKGQSMRIFMADQWQRKRRLF
jgi:hypothetical protein